MASCINCGWVTAPELIRQGLCLTCSEYRWRTGRDRPPPADLARVHRGETWPRVEDPHLAEPIARAGS